MDIGEPKRIITIEPIEEPAPARPPAPGEPVPERAPDEEPAYDPRKVRTASTRR